MATAAKETNLEVNAFGEDKVSRYGWTIASGEGDYRKINKRLLRVNKEVYQREETKSKVLELAKSWSWISCGTITVARRGGVYWVVDGNHRKLAADRRSDISDLPCMVFEVGNVKDEARAFLATNANRKPITALARFKALLAADDITAKLVDDAVRDCGLRFATASKEAGDFKAVSWALETAARDPDGFVVILQAAAELAVAAEAPLHHQVVKGLQYLHANIDGGLEDGRLRKRLRQVGFGALLKGALSAAEYYAKGGAKVYADGMLQALNKGLRTRFDWVQ